MAGAVTHSLVHQFASMKPTEFGATIEPKWKVADTLMKEVRIAVEKKYLTPLDGARVISSCVPDGHSIGAVPRQMCHGLLAERGLVEARLPPAAQRSGGDS